MTQMKRVRDIREDIVRETRASPRRRPVYEYRSNFFGACPSIGETLRGKDSVCGRVSYTCGQYRVV